MQCPDIPPVFLDRVGPDDDVVEIDVAPSSSQGGEMKGRTAPSHHKTPLSLPRNSAIRLVPVAATITLALDPKTVPSLGPKVSGQSHPSVLVALARVKQA